MFFFALLFTNDNVILKVNVAIFRESYLAVVVYKVSETSSRFITHVIKVFLGNVDRLIDFNLDETLAPKLEAVLPGCPFRFDALLDALNRTGAC